MRKNVGFTMVELLIVIAIFSIIAAMGFWSGQSMLPGYRLKGAVTTLRGDLYKAKVLATKEKRLVKVVFSANGYQIQRGTSGSGSFVLDQVLLTRDFSDYADVSVVTGSTADPTFSPRGTATNVTIRLQNVKGDTKDITISIAGRIKIN